ncbi:MAG: membrane protein insertion efficiency factor YidD [Ignavibacteria bacterium]|nr:membrane protein insertion efficiency factor YidD [Ignavibacteria bacterium]MBT8382493.1 membrane protein insertion efficiency factor YidD [Ignavibacteria bacterium]MBT8391800.1 membrane protein insertion efficiency factor YidD [Ignavibacteria bacterium]NNJ51861.1 membrane protein insertion efficiency factor YidD [Ignavibacteriaceae bacterium]NNL21930.1 membrane protein insertion efficiency factor YidD [Ignavibacteriaceae bacterium]
MIKNNLKILFLIIFISTSAFCQLEDLKWKKADLSYEIPNNFRQRDYSFEFNNAGDLVKKSIAYTYWFFISDVDGDNCPFRPSCSAFLMQSVEETNIAQGMLMFFDRFTRDMNIYKGHNHYPRVKTGHYFDPPDNYTLDQETIKYIPSTHIVKE